MLIQGRSHPHLQVEWLPVVIGGGGLIIHLSIADDGTLLCGTDVGGWYKLDRGTMQWSDGTEINKVAYPYFAPNNIGYSMNSQGPGDIRISPSNSNIIYWYNGPANISAPAVDVRLFKSIDGGLTSRELTAFTSLNASTVGAGLRGNNSPDKNANHKIGIDPQNPNVIFVSRGTDPPWRSFDGGATFEAVPDFPTGGTGCGPGSWAFDTSSAVVGGRTQRIMVWVRSVGVYESTDGGDNWTEIDNTRTVTFQGGYFDTAGTYYLSCEKTGAPGTRYISRYMSSTWTDIQTAATNIKVAVHPVTAGRIAILIPTTSIKESFDSGATFANTYAEGSMTFTSTDVPWQQAQMSAVETATCTEFIYDPSDTDAAWICCSQGLIRGYLDGTSIDWIIHVNGIEELVGNDIRHEAPGQDLLLACFDEAGFRKTRTVEGLATPPTTRMQIDIIPLWSELHNVWYLRSDPQARNLIVACGERRFSADTGPFGYSANAGVDWTQFAAIPELRNEHQNIVVNDGVIIWCNSGKSTATAPYYSTDLGTTWTYLDTQLGTTGWGTGFQQRFMLAADEVNPDVFYAFNIWTADNNIAGIWRSTDRGVTWSHLASSNPYSFNTSILGRLMKPVYGVEGHLMISTGFVSSASYPGSTDYFFRSTDGGETWTNLNTAILGVDYFGFGKAAPGASYPTVFFAGFYKGVWGVYRVDNNDFNNPKLLWDSNYGRWILGVSPTTRGIEGDKDIFGRVYAAFGNRGFAYCDSA